MRISPIPKLLVGAALLGVACSRPGDTAKEQEAHRDIRLIEEPSTEKQTVSALEAGKPATRVALPEARTKLPLPPAAEPFDAPAHNHAAMMAELEPQATMRVVTQTEIPAPIIETSLPAQSGPALEGEGDRGQGNTASSGGGSRGPMILIRGGMGNERDDCKIHGIGGLGGFGGGGIAINRVTPPFRSGGNRPSFSGGGGTVRIR